MARYIDRESAHFRCSYVGDCMGNRSDCEECAYRVIDYQDFMEIPTADVIEREKIDEAIDELRKEIEENHLNVIEYADGEWIVKEFIYGAIDRFKEKIALDK